jgi:hypothetical protein
MGNFLKDELVKNVSIDESSLHLISDFFENKEAEINLLYQDGEQDADKRVFLTYIIRFDKKGYRLHGIDEVLRCYRQASKVERVFFTLESAESLRSNKLLGTFIDLKLDAKDQNNCFITVSSDDSKIVDASFANLMEIIEKRKNQNGLIRNNWTQFVVQILGVVFGFIISFWAATRIAPHLAVQSPFLVAFFFAFIVFSNTWGFLNQQILNVIAYSFPSIRFKRQGRDTVHWLMQGLIGGLVVALALFLLEKLFTYFGKILGEFVT